MVFDGFRQIFWPSTTIDKDPCPLGMAEAQQGFFCIATNSIHNCHQNFCQTLLFCDIRMSPHCEQPTRSYSCNWFPAPSSSLAYVVLHFWLRSAKCVNLFWTTGWSEKWKKWKREKVSNCEVISPWKKGAKLDKQKFTEKTPRARWFHSKPQERKGFKAGMATRFQGEKPFWQAL